MNAVITSGQSGPADAAKQNPWPYSIASIIPKAPKTANPKTTKIKNKTKNLIQ